MIPSPGPHHHVLKCQWASLCIILTKHKHTHTHTHTLAKMYFPLDLELILSSFKLETSKINQYIYTSVEVCIKMVASKKSYKSYSKKKPPKKPIKLLNKVQYRAHNCRVMFLDLDWEPNGRFCFQIGSFNTCMK
jgi:hypothetical protein